jgi:hypothetical protein
VARPFQLASGRTTILFPIRAGEMARHSRHGPEAKTIRNEHQCTIDARVSPQHFLYFFPLPQGQVSFRPTFALLCLNDV